MIKVALMLYISYLIHFEDVRIPLLIRGPGVMQNQRIKDINVNIDIAPTIIEMSGQTVNPHNFDGMSLLPLVMEERESYLNKGS